MSRYGCRYKLFLTTLRSIGNTSPVYQALHKTLYGTYMPYMVLNTTQQPIKTLLRQALQIIAPAREGVPAGFGQIIHIGFQPGCGYVAFGQAHEGGHHAHKAQVMHIALKTGAVYALHQLPVFHVLLNEDGDEVLGFHNCILNYNTNVYHIIIFYNTFLYYNLTH